MHPSCVPPRAAGGTGGRQDNKVARENSLHCDEEICLFRLQRNTGDPPDGELPRGIRGIRGISGINYLSRLCIPGTALPDCSCVSWSHHVLALLQVRRKPRTKTTV